MEENSLRPPSIAFTLVAGSAAWAAHQTLDRVTPARGDACGARAGLSDPGHVCARQLPAPVWIALHAWLPDWLRGLLLLGLGLAIVAAAVFFLNASLLKTLLPGSASAKTWKWSILYCAAKTRRQGPNRQTIGGGTGMPQLLRGLREYTDNITAIVTVADDGGSSGRLRRQWACCHPATFATTSPL